MKANIVIIIGTTVKEWAELLVEWEDNADIVGLVKHSDLLEMKAKRIWADMLIIIQAQLEVLAQNTYNRLHQCTEESCKMLT